MLGIFKGDPRDWFLEQPEEPYPWRDGLLQTCREIRIPALKLACLGATAGIAYTLYMRESVWTGALVGAVAGPALSYLVLIIVEEARMKLERFINSLNPFG